MAQLDIAAAEAYAQRHDLHALVVQTAGEVVFERYGPGHPRTAAHALYSGTKGFWGITAVVAAAAGVFDLDEPVGASVPEWRQGLRSRVTLRHLLALTSGIGFGGLGAAVPMYVKALAVEVRDEPGTRFTYGGIPLQVFGAVFAQKLAAGGATPHDFLRERVLDPAGVRIGSWRTLKDGTHPLPTGAFLAARDWLAYGIAARAYRRDPVFADCFRGSQANPRYGLGWWLSPLPAVPDLFYASGASGQALTVIPSLDTVVVKFGNSSSYKHEAFLKRLLP